MTAWKGRGRDARIRRRRDLILAALHVGAGAMTTDEIAAAIGARYGTVYADLRVLCGSNTLTYAEHHADAVNAAGYPVVWHPWIGDRLRTLWSLAPEYAAETDDQAAQLENLYSAPARGDA